MWSLLGQARIELRAQKSALEPLDTAIACYRKREDRSEPDDQELQFTQFCKGRALIESKGDRAAAIALIHEAWTWAKRHQDDGSVKAIRDWARTARVKLPKPAPARP